MHVLSLVAASRGYLLVVRRLLIAVASLVACRLRCKWSLSRAGIKPVSPALAGRFLTTGPSGRLKEGTFELNAERRVCVY